MMNDPANPMTELQCPVCGELQALPEDERDGDSEWSLNPCEGCTLDEDEDEAE